MKAVRATAVLGLSLMTLMGSASAQPYGGPGYGSRERGPGYEERGPGYGDRGPGYGDRRPGYEGRGFAFDEREYLRCNPDVRRSVYRGETESGLAHYRTFGRREGRRLSC
jgi:hypothetical protein